VPAVLPYGEEQGATTRMESSLLCEV
jgi:hypothetical protein